MKKTLLIISSALILMTSPSCSWLDVNPDLGLSEEEVFTNWKNFEAYFNYVYEGTTGSYPTNITLGYPMFVNGNRRRFTFNALTDMCDAGRLVRAQQIKAGKMGENMSTFTTDNSHRAAIASSMFKIIRISNKCIENIDRVKNFKSETDRHDILAQAYFVRAYAHFVLVRYWGGMPYIDKAYEEAALDLARLTPNETLRLCAEDFERAYELFVKAGKLRRDGGPGSANHLNAVDMHKPNGATAKAMKARALLYAASPLNNVGGSADWEAAALACAEAVNVAEAASYELLPWDRWASNFAGSMYTNEDLWAYATGKVSNGSADFVTYYGFGVVGKQATGDNPTQNFVDRFETVWGDPLETPEDRERATELGHYNEQNPYADRDPRFNATIVHDGSIVEGCKTGINICYDPETDKWPMTDLNGKASEFGREWGSNNEMGYSSTGYYLMKGWDGNKAGIVKYYHSEPLIRMAEVYLNYAEAVNEAFGPQGRAGDCQLTALEAVNKVRARAGMPPVQDRFSSDKESLRERIRNERCVELAFEGHHYYLDTRRWKTAPELMSRTLMGMRVEIVPVSEEYPVGRKYIRKPIPENRQSKWKDEMYYFFFPSSEANKMKNFVNNPSW